jgi:predicted Zn-dependent protease
MQAKYSRDFEREADEFAFEYLKTRGVSTDALSDLLLRIDPSGSDGDEGVPGWLSSHPSSIERVDDD